MSTFRADRLEEIIAHVEQHPENWDFENYYYQKSCGTFYCAWGRAPLIWPNDWVFTGDFSTYRSVMSCTGVQPSTWLGIKAREWFMLFVGIDADDDSEEAWPGQLRLLETATAEEWIAYARAFIAYKTGLPMEVAK